MTRTPDTAPSPPAPLAPRHPHPVVRHGERLEDDWFWLRDKPNPEVRAYLEAENAHAEAWMAPLADFQRRLYDELLARIQQTDLSVPYRRAGWLWFSRTEEGRQYPIRCRRRAPETPEEIVLDLNALAEGHSYLGLGAYQPNDDATRLAYSVDTTGFRQYTLHVKDLVNGVVLSEAIPRTVSVAWAADGRTLFYTVEDDAKRPHRVFRHRLGESDDTLVYEETDERFGVGVGRTRSREWIVMTSSSHTASEVRVLRAAEPDGEWRLIAARETDHEYYLDHHGDRFFILTNRDARNFRLVETPVTDPGPSAWRERVPHREHVMLEGVDLFRGHLVLSEREDGLERLRVDDLATGESHRVGFPEPVYHAGLETNAEFDTATLRYAYDSFTTPPSVYDYDMRTRESTLLKRTAVLGGYDPERYLSERRYAVAADGTRIPLSIVYRKGLVRNGTAPLWLYGYGSYGHSLSATFNSSRFSLLDRGVVFVIAHVRGGGELGKAWHDAGRMKHKMNTFTDFIACAETLIRERWTSPDRLVIEGGSAGGLLMGAVANLRPELFAVVVSEVPFVDVLNTMSDATLPLTVGEFEEWGDPSRAEDYAVMRRYCPYTNLAAHDYPTMLVRTSLNDSQVMYWEPAKYVARLRTLKTDTHPLVFRTNMGAGHSGASGRYDFLREVAFKYAFVLDRLGLADRAAL
jgi:oligopeptidase B